MKVLRLSLMLMILQSYAYCQNTTLKPYLVNEYYCFDSTQVREIARLSVHEKTKDTIINIQDSIIYNLRIKIDNHRLNHIKKDSIISNQETIIANKDTIHDNTIKTCQIEKKQSR